MDLIEVWRCRSWAEKFIDVTGLAMQSFLVPIAATYLGTQVLPHLISIDKDALVLPLWVQFLLPFTLIDYIYYWNHRLMHRSEFWWLHRVHHTSKKLDIFVTSRNSIWTVFFFVYIWAHAFLIFSQKDPSGFFYGMYLLSAMDLWRHSSIQTPNWARSLGAILILPEDHEWHHARDKEGINFGGNLNLWDRCHGTFYRSWNRPFTLGETKEYSLWLNLFFPWRAKE